MSEPFKGRREDGRLVTGAGRYTSDWNRPRQAHAVFLRADRAHAVIGRIDTSAARSVAGVLAILSGDDMAAEGYTRGQAFMPFKGRGEALKVLRAPALAQGRVRFVGEAVVLVVAETEDAARAAAEVIAIDYEDLLPVVEARLALEPGAPLLHDSIPGNLCFDFDFGDREAADAAFAKAAHVVTLQHESERLSGNPMEPKAALLDWSGDVLEMWSSSQGVAGMRQSMATLTGLPEEKIRVHAQDVGGAFGVRSHAYPEYAALALAARQLKRPVKWVATRSETFVSDYHGRGINLSAQLALNSDGDFLAIRHDWIADMGAFPSAAGAVYPFCSPRNDGLRGLSYSGCVWSGSAGRHQCRAGHGLSRCRPA